MQNTTYYLPGFHLPTLRRRPRSASQFLAEKRAQLKHKTLSELGECFRQFIPTQHLEPSDAGHSSRRRLFSKENTFWAFFSQVLDADRGCREVVRKLQALCASQSKPLPSSSTAAYCQARASRLRTGSRSGAGRREPRARKRRPNNYQLMTVPRHEMKEIPHRSSYRAKQA